MNLKNKYLIYFFKIKKNNITQKNSVKYILNFL